MIEQYKIFYQVSESLKFKTRKLADSIRTMSLGIKENDKYKIYNSFFKVDVIGYMLYQEISRVKDIENHLYYNEFMEKAKELKNIETLPEEDYNDYKEENYEDYKNRLKVVGRYLEELVAINIKMKEDIGAM